MKINITWDEWYPVYEIGQVNSGVEVELTKAQVSRLKRATKAFNAIQNEVAAVVNAALKEEKRIE